MPQKSKFTAREKVKIVERCLRGETSKNAAAKENGIDGRTLDTWIRLYESRGIEGLQPAKEARKYSIETKYGAVKAYLSGAGSLEEICRRYDISRHGMLQQWVICYNSHGGFKRPNSGGGIYMVNGRKVTQEEKIEIVSYCIAENKDYGKAIERYRVSYQQIYSWVRKYEEQGVEGLRDRRGKRKALSEMDEVAKLRAQIKLKEAENRRLQMENDLLKKLAELERG